MSQLPWQSRGGVTPYDRLPRSVKKQIPKSRYVQICAICGDHGHAKGFVFCNRHVDDFLEWRDNFEDGHIPDGALTPWIHKHSDSWMWPNGWHEGFCPACEKRRINPPDYLCRECRYGL